ncbi:MULTISPECIES: hypothetical protein [Methylobacter]
MLRGSQSFVGNLFAPRWPDRPVQPSWDSIIDITREEVNEVAGWCSYRLTTNLALLREQETASDHGKFVYRFLVRQSDVRFLLVCTAKEVLAHLLRIAGMENRVASPTIDVTKLVSTVVEHPKDYALSRVYARIDGYGQSFRSISMYGSDLADAKLFRDIAPRVAPYRVTLRSQIHHEDVLTVSSRGEVGFMYRGSNSLRQVDDALRFLAQNKFMNWNLE